MRTTNVCNFGATGCQLKHSNAPALPELMGALVFAGRNCSILIEKQAFLISSIKEVFGKVFDTRAGLCYDARTGWCVTDDVLENLTQVATSTTIDKKVGSIQKLQQSKIQAMKNDTTILVMPISDDIETHRDLRSS